MDAETREALEAVRRAWADTLPSRTDPPYRQNFERALARIEQTLREAARLRGALETIEREDEVEFPARGWQAKVARAALSPPTDGEATSE